MTIDDSIRPITRVNQAFVNPLGSWSAPALYSSIPLPDVDEDDGCLPCVLCGVLSTEYREVLESIIQTSESRRAGQLFGVGSDVVVDVVESPSSPPPPAPPGPPTPPES